MRIRRALRRGFGCNAAVWLAASVATLAAISVSGEVAANPVDDDLFAIGAKLFSDSRLSADGSVSCASCHVPSRAFADGKPVAIGLHGAIGVRNTPSLTTVNLHRSFLWDGRRSSLESQILGPLLNPREQGLSSAEAVVAVVKSASDYPARFRNGLTIDRVTNALAQYVRSISPGSSRFDRYWRGKDVSALSQNERHGFEIFRGSAGCLNCHRIDGADVAFTDDQFHWMGPAGRHSSGDLAGAAMRAANASPPELERLITSDAAVATLGRFNVTKRPADIGKYRTPSLRNVAVTAPYMHDGSVATLREAIELELYYRSAERGRPVILSAQDKRDLVEFLQALTAESLENRQ